MEKFSPRYSRTAFMNSNGMASSKLAVDGSSNGLVLKSSGEVEALNQGRGSRVLQLRTTKRGVEWEDSKRPDADRPVDPSPMRSALSIKSAEAQSSWRDHRAEEGTHVILRRSVNVATSAELGARMQRLLARVEGKKLPETHAAERATEGEAVAALESAVVESHAVEVPQANEQPIAISTPAPDSSTFGQSPTSAGGLRLKRKTDSVVESRRDASLLPVEKPVCCNCRASFEVPAELALLTRISCPRCSTRQVVPARIENFILESQLGAGGMGVTYRAFDESLHRNVAIKLISGELAGNREHVDAMVREARRAAGITHPHIVPIHSIGSVDGTPYIVMELLSDGLLSRPVAKGMQLEERFVLETGLAVAKALAATSELGILHLDIKPANILHDRFKVAKIIDFGLACRSDEDTSTGMGTCLYMPPERLRRDGQDSRCDQYSLGLTMWQALAGKAPFDAPTRKELVKVILRTAPELLNVLRPDLHLWTAGLIHKMIAYHASDRYQTYDELLGAFQVVLEALNKETNANEEAP